MDSEKIGVVIEDSNGILVRDKAYIFDKEGGYIGSDPQCSFCVQDKDNKIHGKHVRISFEEGFFTIAPVEDAIVFYNESFSKMQGGFETIVNRGDSFKIADIRFNFVDCKEIDEVLIGKETLDSIEKHDEIDEELLNPRGRVKFDFKEQESIKELIDAKPDYAFVGEKSGNDFLNNTKQVLGFEYENIIRTLDKALMELQVSKKNPRPSEAYGKLDIKDLESIIASIPLIKSTKLINLMALSLISKELYSPIFEEIQENTFIKYLQTAIQESIKEEKPLLENLVLKALIKYKK